MLRYLLALVTLGLPICVSGQCPVTRNSQPKSFVPPAPYLPHSGEFLYGSNSLWTDVADDVRAVAAGGQGLLSLKLVYWRAGFDWLKESNPKLAVVARRLDGLAPLVWADAAHGVKFPENDGPEGMAMMTGIAFPTEGCWEISANYQGQTLSYVVSVRP